MFLLIAVFAVLGSAFVSGCGDGPSRTTGTASAALNPVVVRPSLDRTAAWVGDSLTYSLEIVCSPGYDIVEDDLGRDHLPLEGLVVRAANSTRETRDDGVVVYRGRFELASFSPENERLRIGPLSIRYYRKDADGRINAQLPVGTVAVPEEDVALRSTLPESVGLALRVARTPALLPSFTRVLNPLGATLIALSLVTVALGLKGTIGRRPAAPRAKSPARPASIDYRTALSEIRQLEDTAGPEALRHAFDRLDHLLRTFLTETDVHARSLTPDEIDSKLNAGGDATPPRAVAQVLRDCERVRYGGPSQPPSREVLARALDQAEKVLVPAGGAER
jgi:hypothetical protein